jgi:altronate dehydratase
MTKPFLQLESTGSLPDQIYARIVQVILRGDFSRRWHDLMDINAGWELFHLMLEVASGGKKTWAKH